MAEFRRLPSEKHIPVIDISPAADGKDVSKVGSSAERKRHLYIFLAIMFGILFSDSMILTVAPAYITKYIAADVGHASFYFGVYSALKAAMQFLLNPTYGQLSDKFGRRPLLLSSLMIMVLGNSLMFLIPSLPTFVVFSALSSFSAMAMEMSFAVVADLSLPEEMGKQFSLVGISFGCAFSIGPLLGGFLGQSSPRMPFLASTVVAVMNVFWTHFMFKETNMSAVKTQSFRLANPLASMKMLATDGALRSLAVITFFNGLSFGGFTIWPLFAEQRLDWQPMDTGFFLTAVGVISIASQAFITGTLLPRLGDRRTLILALTFEAFRYVTLAFTTNTWEAYAGLVVCFMSFVVIPMMRAVGCAGIPEDQQGSLNGALGSVVTVSSVLGPLIATQAFTWSSSLASAGLAPDWFVGFPYYLCTLFALVALVWTRFMIRSLDTRSAYRILAPEAASLLPDAEPDVGTLA